MEHLTPTQIWTAMLAVASAIVLLSNAAKAIAQAWQAAKAPDEAQDTRLDDLEAWKKAMDAENLPGRVNGLETWRTEAKGMLTNDKKELAAIHNGMKVSHLAQLALLDHALNGNNIGQMQDAKDALQQYLAGK